MSTINDGNDCDDDGAMVPVAQWFTDHVVFLLMTMIAMQKAPATNLQLHTQLYIFYGDCFAEDAIKWEVILRGNIKIFVQKIWGVK